MFDRSELSSKSYDQNNRITKKLHCQFGYPTAASLLVS